MSDTQYLTGLWHGSKHAVYYVPLATAIANWSELTALGVVSMINMSVIMDEQHQRLLVLGGVGGVGGGAACLLPMRLAQRLVGNILLIQQAICCFECFSGA